MTNYPTSITGWTNVVDGVNDVLASHVNNLYIGMNLVADGIVPIQSGATLPTSPEDNQLFMHTPTGRRVLMVYTGSAWYPVYSFGAMTVYVDGTNGTDSADKGTGTGTSAWKTLSYMWTQLPVVFYGNITINVSAGTYAETLTAFGKRPGGNYTITLSGEESEIDTGTVTSGVQGTTSTLGTLTDTGKSWTANEHRGRWAKIGSNYRVIESNTADTLTIAGYFAATPSGTYSIVEMASIVNSASSYALRAASGQQLTIQRMKFVGPDASVQTVNIASDASVIFSVCHLETYTNRVHTLYIQKGRISVTDCYFDYKGNTSFSAIDMYNSYCDTFNRNLIYRDGTALEGRGIRLYAGSHMYLESPGPNVVDRFLTNIQVVGDSSINFLNSTYWHIKNATTGILASNGGQVAGTSNNQYSGNTTNESATAASYGYID